MECIAKTMIACSGPICYCRGYKYQTQYDWWVVLPITGVDTEIPGFIKLESSGKLTIYAKYAWDGATDAIDTRDFMRGSLAHDALYQLMREGKLNPSHRETVDRFLVDLCREDGMSDIRCAWVYYAVREFAIHAAERRDRERYYAGTDPNVR